MPPEGRVPQRNMPTETDPIYTLGAALIGADGKVEPEEIALAEEVGAKLMPEFDRIEFRECCSDFGSVPDFRATVDSLASEIGPERRREVYDYLRGIAMADGEVAQSERELLLYVRQRWEI